MPRRRTIRACGCCGRVPWRNSSWCDRSVRTPCRARCGGPCPTIAGRSGGDPGIRVVVVRGEGPSFSAGADIGEFAQVFADETAAHAYNELVQGALSALAELEQPTIAQITGNCIGGGCGLAVACDLRFAAADARLGITPARLGLAYSLGEIKRLIELVGVARAKDLPVLGPAGRQRRGAADRPARPGGAGGRARRGGARLRQDAPDPVGQFAAADQAPDAADPRRRHGRDRKERRSLRDGAVSHPDFTEGRRAFLEKRRPRFE